MILIRLTEQGRDAQPNNMEFTGIFTCLTQEDQEKFGEYLDRVIAALEAHLGDEVDEEAASAWEKDARERFGDAWMERFRDGPHGAQPFRRGPMHRGERGGPMERGPRPMPHKEWRNLTEGGPAEDNKTLSECRDENQPPKSNPHNIDGN